MEKESCKTVSEVADYVISEVVEKQGGLKKFKDNFPDLNSFIGMQHHNLGRWIRNNFGLWSEEGNGPVITQDALANYKSRHDGEDVINHPDEISSVILTEIWEKVLNSDADKG